MVDVPIENGDFHSYVSLPEGTWFFHCHVWQDLTPYQGDHESQQPRRFPSLEWWDLDLGYRKMGEMVTSASWVVTYLFDFYLSK